MSSHLSRAITEKFRCSDSAYAFLVDIMSNATVYLFGGAVRDFLSGKLDSSRDIDFVVEANVTDRLDIEEYLRPFDDVTYKKNRFDGYKIDFNNQLTVDIWNLRDTWAFRMNKMSPSAENLMRSVYLNIDALVYSMNTNVFLDNCDDAYINITKEQLLDIVFYETPFEDLNLLRALVFKKKYSLTFSPNLRNRLVNCIRNRKTSVVDSFIDLQIAHYNQVLLDRAELSHAFHHLLGCRNSKKIFGGVQ